MRTLFSRISALCSLLMGVVLSRPALAGYGLEETAATAQLPTGGTIQSYSGIVIGAALALSGTIFLVLMVYAGIMYMTAAGDTDKVKKAKEIIKDTIIGVVLIGLSYAILNFIFSIFAQ